jgi:hypothetical protein
VLHADRQASQASHAENNVSQLQSHPLGRSMAPPRSSPTRAHAAASATPQGLGLGVGVPRRPRVVTRSSGAAQVGLAIAVQDGSPQLPQTEGAPPPPLSSPPQDQRLLQQAATHSEGVHDLLSSLVRSRDGGVGGDANQNSPQQGPQGGTALLGAISNLMHTLRPSSNSSERLSDT